MFYCEDKYAERKSQAYLENSASGLSLNRLTLPQPECHCRLSKANSNFIRRDSDTPEHFMFHRGFDPV